MRYDAAGCARYYGISASDVEEDVRKQHMTLISPRSGMYIEHQRNEMSRDISS